MKTGIPYSFLRNNWYLKNEIGSIKAAMVGAPWMTSAGHFDMILRRPAANILTGEGHENIVYVLFGKLMMNDARGTSICSWRCIWERNTCTASR
ncbi:TPA: hypothetical protein QCX34_004215 [Bacillus anthracis]|uniref:hypothetical protein n=1 Tax=Bacillus cereus TaxID=1396 RepID=UPI001155697F|nr:hypothetical protein [Bacillus cereus]MBJ8061787.1 hypothetical protein [Bacillus cereus]HDR7436670.1 hypothetical protein [Bacillus anthracis]